jgi:hypothetical protein
MTKIDFPGFPGLDFGILKFHDFPGFPGPVQALNKGYFRVYPTHPVKLSTFPVGGNWSAPGKTTSFGIDS